MGAKRKPHQKQDTPRMQLAAILQAVWSGLEWSDLSNETKRKKLLAFVEEAQEILKGMPEGEWEKDQIWSHSDGSGPHNAT